MPQRYTSIIFDAFQIHSQLWIVNEYCPGASFPIHKEEKEEKEEEDEEDGDEEVENGEEKAVEEEMEEEEEQEELKQGMNLA